MESQSPDTVERIDIALAVRDTNRMAQAFRKIEGQEDWSAEDLLNYIVEELLNELIQKKIPFIFEEAEQFSKAIHNKIVEEEAPELLEIVDLRREIEINVYRHLVYAHRKTDSHLTPSERLRQKIVEGIAGGESAQDTEQEFSEFIWSQGPEKAATARRIQRGEEDRSNLVLRQEAGIWVRIPQEISDDVAMARPLLNRSIQWNKNFRVPAAFYLEVQNRIAMWALERFHNKEAFLRGRFFFAQQCLIRLQPVYELLLMNESYLAAYRKELMTEGAQGSLPPFKDLEKLIAHLIEEVHMDHFEYAKTQNALAAAVRNEARAELIDLIPGLFDGETPGGSPRIDTTEPDKS